LASFILSLSPVTFDSTIVSSLVTSVAIAAAFATDAFVASGFVQFSMIVMNLTNEWLKKHMLRAYALNPVYILSTLIFLVILLFLIIRFLSTLNPVVTMVPGVTVLVLLYCMEISFAMGTKTLQYSPHPSQYYSARPRLTPKELRFIKSFYVKKLLNWLEKVFWSTKTKVLFLPRLPGRMSNAGFGK
jgi:hypothetical protein